jgi:hypothetical protein
VVKENLTATLRDTLKHRAGDLQTALGEAEAGLLDAISCGYGLLRIELSVALSRIRLAWPDPPRAMQAARGALDLAPHPDCQYTCGEADAAQAWGEAYFANHEHTHAARIHSRTRTVDSFLTTTRPDGSGITVVRICESLSVRPPRAAPKWLISGDWE